MSSIATAPTRNDSGTEPGRAEALPVKASRSQLAESLGRFGWTAASIGLFAAIWEFCWLVGLADPKLLPPLFIAYRTDLSEISGVVHSNLRARWEAMRERPAQSGALPNPMFTRIYFAVVRKNFFFIAHRSSGVSRKIRLWC